MKKRIVNILKYILFLGIGVVLFYLATLDITRGTLSADQNEVPFVVGHGLEECDLGGTIGLSVLCDRPQATLLCTIVSTTNNKAFQPELSYGQDSKELVSTVCLPSDSYILQVSSGDAEINLAISGVDRTDELLRDMSKANWWGILVSFILGYLAIVSRGMRWLILLEPMGYRPKMWNSIHSVAFAYFANTFVPRSGELARCAVLNQTDDVPVDKLFGTVISERVVDFVMLFAMTGLAVATNLGAFETLRANMMGGGEESTDEGSSLFLIAGLSVVVGLLLFVALRKRIQQSGIYKKIVAFIEGVLEGLKTVLKMKRRGMFVFHTIFIWSMYFLMAFVIFKSIDATSEMGVFDALFVMVAGGFGMVLPAPGGIGSYHWAVKLGFIALGMSGTLGFAVANVIWLTQTGMIILGGGIGYLAIMAYKLRKDRMHTSDG